MHMFMLIKGLENKLKHPPDVELMTPRPEDHKQNEQEYIIQSSSDCPDSFSPSNTLICLLVTPKGKEMFVLFFFPCDNTAAAL